MIEASFERMAERSAAVSGAYQYDTGQRLRMHGLPAPEELAERDDFLSGDVVTVQAQYAFMGESQTEMRLAVYDEETGTWMAAVPDRFLTRCADVHVYIYVGYGQTEESMRAKTCYEVVFRPVSRPAPGTDVTPDQKNAWDALAQEVNLAIADMERAASNANAQAVIANEAAQRADEASGEAEKWLTELDATVVTAETLPPGSGATVTVTDRGTHREVAFGIPKGDPGIIRINGKEISDKGEVTLTAADVGALPDTHTAAVFFEATLSPDDWHEYENYSLATQYVTVEGLRETDNPVIDLDSRYGISQEVLNAWARVAFISAHDDLLIASSMDGVIDKIIPIRLMCVR